MDILLFIEIRVNSQHIRPASYVTESRLGRLLHYIPQVTCEFKVSGTFHNGYFHIQNLSTDGSIGKAPDKANLIPHPQFIRLVFCRAENGFQLSCLQAEALELLLGNTAGGLAAGSRYLTFQKSYTGFSGV